jgi:hypothetical protein
MKNSILLIWVVLVLINTTAGLTFQDYATHKMFFSDFSIILTTGLLYLMYQMKTADGFKIGFTLIFTITGLIRFICAVSSSSGFQSNYAVLIFIIFLCIECILIFVSHALRKK